MRIALAALIAVAACAPASAEPAARLARAIDAMERLEGFRFELRATVDASGRGAPGGAVRDDVRMIGEYAAPDRLHVAILSPRGRTDVVLVERRTYIDDGAGYRQSVRVPLGPLRDARAPLTFLRGGGAASFAGIGLARGSLTYRVRLHLDAGDLSQRVLDGAAVPPDARGTIEVEIGLFDDLVRRQVVEIASSLDPFAAGLESARTAYTVEYWAHGQRQEVREPE